MKGRRKAGAGLRWASGGMGKMLEGNYFRKTKVGYSVWDELE